LRHQGELGKPELARPEEPKELQLQTFFFTSPSNLSAFTTTSHYNVHQADEAVE